jgi:hypothetical protein
MGHDRLNKPANGKRMIPEISAAHDPKDQRGDNRVI